FAVPILDARRSEFYGALFRKMTPAPEPGTGAVPPVASRLFSPAGDGFVLGPAPISDLIKSTANGIESLTCIVRDHETATAELKRSLPPGIGWTSVRGHLLAPIARLARAGQLEGTPPSWRELDAYYIRRTDAEVNLKD
ncbi:MAG: hypothetical protein ACRD2O_08375, partial [Terriglobia bacterium]